MTKKNKFKVFNNTVVKLTGTKVFVVDDSDSMITIENFSGIAKGYGRIGNNDKKLSHIVCFLFPDRPAYPLGYFKTKLHRDVAFQYITTGCRLNKEISLMRSYFMGSLVFDDILTDILANNVNLDTLLQDVPDEYLASAIKQHKKTWLNVSDIREVASTRKSLMHWTSAQDKAFYAFMATVINSPFEEWNSMDILYTLYYQNENVHY
jgi:hypothetical protein